MASYSIKEIAWLSDTGFAAILQGRFEQSIAFFEDGQASAILDPASAPPGTYTDLRVSPRGTYIAFEWRPGDIFILNREALLVSPPGQLPRASAITWSPDERWAAVTTPGSIYVFSTTQERPAIRLPLAADDLAWR